MDSMYNWKHVRKFSVYSKADYDCQDYPSLSPAKFVYIRFSCNKNVKSLPESDRHECSYQ